MPPGGSLEDPGGVLTQCSTKVKDLSPCGAAGDTWPPSEISDQPAKLDGSRLRSPDRVEVVRGKLGLTGEGTGLCFPTTSLLTDSTQSLKGKWLL